MKICLKMNVEVWLGFAQELLRTVPATRKPLSEEPCLFMQPAWLIASLQALSATEYRADGKGKMLVHQSQEMPFR
jgi:hypothetical protein